METDGYALGIPESKLRRAASGAARDCLHQPESQLRACVAKAVRREVCPCLYCASEILGALEDDFRAQMWRAQRCP